MTIYFANILWIHYFFRDLIMNLLSFWEINYKFTFFSRIYYLFTIFIADSSRNHLVFRELTMNSLSISGIFLWIHYLFRGSTRNLLYVSRIHYLFREYFMNPLSISRIHHESTIVFANSLSIWRIHYELTWCFASYYKFTVFLAN